ncbi:hypothetical protein PM082_015633 [Marasmius tenuissimus]|nr:hypothetical protein PM082_015633 [Marasmius tenuissimus]
MIRLVSKRLTRSGDQRWKAKMLAILLLLYRLASSQAQVSSNIVSLFSKRNDSYTGSSAPPCLLQGFDHPCYL